MILWDFPQNFENGGIGMANRAQARAKRIEWLNKTLAQKLHESGLVKPAEKEAS